MPSFREGEDLDDYDLVQEIGRGSRSIVHKAVCIRGRLCSRVLAIKTPFPETHLPGNIIRSQLVGLHKELHHPNILTLYFVIPQLAIQIMEYCPLGNLVDFVNRKPLAESSAVPILRGLGNALVYLHDRYIAHRAIQPAHILLDLNRTPKLCHFESAIQVPSESDHPCFHPCTEYTAPEIVQGKQGGLSADMWSLGCVILYMLLGHLPSVKIAPELALRKPGRSLGLCDAVSGMLNQLPSDRPSATALVSSRILNTNNTLKKAGTLVNKDHVQKPITPQAAERHTKPRRLSLEDFRQQQLRKLLANNTKRIFSGATRRTVSDPLPTRKDAFRKPKEPGQWDRPNRASLGFNIPAVTEASEAGRSTEELPLIDTSCLRPQSLKYKHALVSILSEERILIEPQEKSKGMPGKMALLIYPHHNQVCLYENLTSKCHLRNHFPTAQYTRDNLPSELRKIYHLAPAAIDQMKKRTPKIVINTADGRFSLMMNGPPGDIEASFSQRPRSHTTALLTDDHESNLRIRYSQDQSLVELRRYVGGGDGNVWMKKCMTSVSDLEKIPGTELSRLDEAEKEGLTRLIKFLEACKTIEDLGLLDQVASGGHPSTDLHTKAGENCKSTTDAITPLYFGKQVNWIRNHLGKSPKVETRHRS